MVIHKFALSRYNSLLFHFQFLRFFCLVWHCLRYDLMYVVQLLSCGIGVFAATAIPLDPEDEGTRFLLNFWNYSSTATASRSNCILTIELFVECC